MSIKRDRRLLLATLKLVYPGVFDFDQLCLALPTIDRDHLKQDISYLLDKGMVLWVNTKSNQPWSDREFKLTALGVETADKINDDPALEP